MHVLDSVTFDIRKALLQEKEKLVENRRSNRFLRSLFSSASSHLHESVCLKQAGTYLFNGAYYQGITKVLYGIPGLFEWPLKLACLNITILQVILQVSNIFRYKV